jgi:hypothetical protein
VLLAAAPLNKLDINGGGPLAIELVGDNLGHLALRTTRGSNLTSSAQGFNVSGQSVALSTGFYGTIGEVGAAVACTNPFGVTNVWTTPIVADGTLDLGDQNHLIVPGHDPSAMATADFDQDGAPDIAVLDSTGLIVLHNVSTGVIPNFTANAPIATLSNPHAMAVADFDRDGFPDIAVATDSGIQLFLNDRKGGFQAATGNLDLSPSPASVTAIVAADFDGNGGADLAVAGPDHAVHVVLNRVKSPGATALSDIFGPATSVIDMGDVLAVGDVVGDTIPDLIIASSFFGGDTGVDVLRGLGDTTIIAALDPASDSGVSSSDEITSVTTPTFRGSGPAGQSVAFIGLRDGDTNPKLIARGVIGPTGSFSLTVSTPLADGAYTVSAILFVTSAGFNIPLAQQPLAFNNPLDRLIIDSAGPRVASTSLDASAHTVRLFFSDAGSMASPSLLNPANYRLAVPAGLKRTPLKITSVEVMPGSAGQMIAILHFVPGKVRINSKSKVQVTAFAAGITDVAGNKLDGAFNGTSFPSGNRTAGSDFIQTFNAPPPKKKKPGGGKP